MQQSYTPSDKILEKYADVLVTIGLGHTKGPKKGETVWLQFPEVAKPLLYWVYKKVLEKGAHPVIDFIPSSTEKYKFERTFYELAKTHQLDFYNREHLEAKLNSSQNRIAIVAETDKHELSGIDAKKISRKTKAKAPYTKLYFDKLQNDSLSRTVALYGTDQMAAEVGLTTKQYWNQIIKACFLNEENPVQAWRNHIKKMSKIADKLTELRIDSVHVHSENVDLHIGIGADKRWISTDGDNIPSFEVFTSPDWRRVNGEIKFDMPLYAFGNVAKDVYLKFKDGQVIKSSASEGADFINKLLKTDAGAKRVGEFSLTDKRHSPINKFMGETLYDENFGGKYGNTHIALGNAYRDCVVGDPTKINAEEFDENGFNQSAIHEDMFSTENRIVTATLQDGSKKVIYENGEFTL